MTQSRITKPSTLTSLAKRARELPELYLIVWGGLFNGVWEFAQSPLYTDHTRGWWYVVWTRLHCTVGDIMILTISFWLTCILLRSRVWMLEKRSPGVFFLVLFGLGYTVFSEWYNTSVSVTWEYTAAMPVVLGIGLTPVLQWLIIPPLVGWATRWQLSGRLPGE